jgi:PPOX class probable F420-dependent enzyme
MARGQDTKLDLSSERGKRVQSRLESEVIIWLATVGPDARPHAVPVWFWWDGDSFLVYSVPGQKVRDIESNPNVELHLNTSPSGGNVVRIDATAKLLPDHAPAYAVPEYIRKYGTHIKRNSWTPESFSALYHIAMRVRPTRFR